jgi:hypothetical protein
MGGQNSWRQIQSGADWMREVEKRLLHEERRPGIRTASDILGPGIGPFSVEVNDWNSSETAFNGFFHSEPGAINAPDSVRFWMGTSQATAEGYGIQRVTDYRGDPISGVVWVRRFGSLVPGAAREFGPWTREDGGDTGWLDMTSWASGWIPAGGLGGPGMWQARQIGNKVYLRGNAKNDTFSGSNITVCTLPTGISPPPQTWGFTIVGSSQTKWGNVLATGVVTASAPAATPGSWMQIVGYYFTD